MLASKAKKKLHVTSFKLPSYRFKGCLPHEKSVYSRWAFAFFFSECLCPSQRGQAFDIMMSFISQATPMTMYYNLLSLVLQLDSVNCEHRTG